MFELGKIAVTHSAESALRDSQQSAEEFIARHRSGDWGDITEETRRANEEGLRDGLKLESIYHTRRGEKLLVVTDADRALTSVMTPEEF